MPKNKSSFLTKLGKFLVFVFKTLEFCLILAIIGFALFLWQKPQYLSQWLQIPTVNINNDSPENSAKIEAIDNKIETLEIIAKNNSEKADLIQQQFQHFDKSKADSEQIINLNNQINDIRNTAKKLSQTSNSGALILTSAMLIRDNISRGINCKNEAEALKILAQNIDSVNNDVEFIASHCDMDFISDNTIINRFNTIYSSVEESLKPKEEQNWKQRLISKINEYIRISNSRDNKEETYNPLKSLSPIKQLVNNHDFAAALDQLLNSSDTKLMENQDINEWYNQTKNQLHFYKALSNIINASLLIMKVEDAKNTTD